MAQAGARGRAPDLPRALPQFGCEGQGAKIRAAACRWWPSTPGRPGPGRPPGSRAARRRPLGPATGQAADGDRGQSGAVSREPAMSPRRPCPAHLDPVQPAAARAQQVRDNYAVGDDHLLMVASDRLDAFDVVMGPAHSRQGRVLTQMALFWFDVSATCARHLTGDDRVGRSADEARPGARPPMLVRRLRPVPVEAVVRATWPAAAGRNTSGRDRSAACRCRQACERRAQLPEPSSPPPKAAGEGDENISFAQTVERIGADLPASATPASPLPGRQRPSRATARI